MEQTKPYKVNEISYWLVLVAMALGYASYLEKYTITIVWAVVVIGSIYSLLVNKAYFIWYAIALSPFLEVWSRMVKRVPLVPMEVGKYFLLLACILLLIDHFYRNKNRGLYNAGMYIILALTPSLVVAFSVFDREQWTFNILSMLELAILLIVTSKERFDIDRVCNILQVSLLPMLSIAVFLTLKTPDYNDIDFKLGANKEASGGFGSNQVSSIIGMGMTLIVLLVQLKRPFFKIIWLNYLLLGYLAFRGLLTFSRGGVIGALLAIVISLLPQIFNNIRAFFRTLALIIILGLLGVLIFNKVNDITDNQLLLRYEGETTDTKNGLKTKTLNTSTSGREEIVVADLAIFANNSFFGVGPGQAKELRPLYGTNEESAAHIEVTRLLAEHGIGGAIVVLIFLGFPIYWVRKQKNGVWKSVSSGLFTIAIFTSMHSAMRTNITVVCYALAAMPVLLNPYWKAKFGENK